MLRVVTNDGSRAEMQSAIDEICAEGARRMLAAALEAEVDGYITALANSRGEDVIVSQPGRIAPTWSSTWPAGSPQADSSDALERVVDPRVPVITHHDPHL